MERLSDGVLLKVMQYLGVDDLFTCRLVCKKLAGLALHPDAWRHQSCDGVRGANGQIRVCRVLRLAPCLGRLVFRVESNSRHLSHATTRCAVRELELCVSEACAVHATLFLRSQWALGRLTSVKLKFDGEAGPAARVLFGALASTSGLDRLQVAYAPPDKYCDPKKGLRVQQCTDLQPSLEYFKCDVRPGLERFVNLVLARHASTLEVVDLGGTECLTVCSMSTSSLLGDILNLRELTCPLLLQMEALSTCESLRKITLHVTSEMHPSLHAGVELLRRATQLRAVTLKYASASHIPADPGAELVGALRHCRRLACLRIDNDYDPSRDTDVFGRRSRFAPKEEHLPMLQPLVAALPSMPSLDSLQLDVYATPVELLLAITPSTAPALRQLYLAPMHPTKRDTPACAHGWWHEDSVQQLLAANPALALSVWETPHCRASALCEFCELGCHRSYWNSDSSSWIRIQ